jgi:pilus assembly protein CpaB
LRISTIVMIGLAAVFGLVAVFVAQSWLTNQSEKRIRSIEASNQSGPVAAGTIVVASKPLRFGAELASGSLREIPQPMPGVSR